ncbi:Lrp/AsnC ligand binding domain-containing protein [Ferroplasma acidiphilum]|jgi:DNA-binding Lrp family transcriptional regulator|uniref:Lrp/AsnC ligand binding domain-containing protein n=1 Tax=Ferroplasma acidiphilum TaxID=74969 RepID=A0A1V0N629_9ARCH|nr:Lrp/AsnC ligand binding domain-containing protein [Ferroplasma acidiphilum]ARD85608.1 transcription regulator [Ferroplasma acidiphilum]MCL4349448.1 Lrp/AsnC ligand binding domain-containing protein [Candidatus Thermoplasmatota archaeon]NOL59453.1 Lrp/AsnC ligand binding domain-containing protein [Ferroplasma acidiphilum]WMT52745.1 MAG: Lrp/AsnC ligand binding domain-containing protein [Ferroplasma acidiphilum]
MSVAFVLIRVIPGKEHEVYDRVSTLKYVTEIHPLLGEFDILVRIDTEDMSEIGKLIIQDIRSISGVVDTKTLAEIKL